MADNIGGRKPRLDKAMDALESGREAVASGLESAASGIQSAASRLPGKESVQPFARRTADKLGAGADYLRRHRVQEAVDGARDVIRENPVPVLLAAVALGFVAARAMRRG